MLSETKKIAKQLIVQNIMGMKFSHICTRAVLYFIVSAAFFPAGGYAATVVSQTFPNDTYYFDVGTKQSYMVVEGKIFESTAKPDVAQVWSYTGHDLVWNDTTQAGWLIDHNLMTKQATTFNGAAYMLVETSEYEDVPEGEGPIDSNLRQEVWKLSVNSGSFTWERVYSETDDITDGYDRLRELFVYDGKLFLVDATYQIYKTKDGEQWGQVNHNLPVDTDYYFYPTADHLYAGAYGTNQTKATLYSSRKGKHWVMEKGSYRKTLNSNGGEAEVGIVQITGSDSRLYLQLQTSTDQTSIWSKALVGKSAKWKKALTSNETLLTMLATTDAVMLAWESAYGKNYLDQCSDVVTQCETVWESYSASLPSYLGGFVSRDNFLFWVSESYDEQYLLRV